MIEDSIIEIDLITVGESDMISCSPGPCVINDGCDPDRYCTPDD